MPERTLLEKQNELLSFLLNPKMFDGEKADAKKSKWLEQIDVVPLELIGRIALTKRMRKVQSVFQNTFNHFDKIGFNPKTGFAVKYIQTDISKRVNAEQFLNYLEDQIVLYQAFPEFIYDLAKLEMAIWQVSREIFSNSVKRSIFLQDLTKENRNIKIYESVRLVSCKFDIHCLIDREMTDESPEEKITFLAVSPRENDIRPNVTELPAEIFDWLTSLKTSDDFRPISKLSTISHSEISLLHKLNIIEISL